MSSPTTFTPPLSKASSTNSRWRKAHFNRDRAIFQATLPLALVRECDQNAEALGLSRAAYLAGALSLAAEFRDQMVLRVQLLERQHGITFRKKASPVGAPKVAP